MDVEPAAGDAPPRRGSRWTFAALVLWVLAADAWFQGPLLGGRVPPAVGAWLMLALVVVVAVRTVRRASGARSRTGAFVVTVAGILLLATLVRLPALMAPGSLISSDSAVAGIIAQELREGRRPAPIYAPGFPYEGTLKPHLTALLAWLLPVSVPSVYAWTSHLFHVVWTIAVMVLARHAGGLAGAMAAGLFMAISPRFL